MTHPHDPTATHLTRQQWVAGATLAAAADELTKVLGLDRTILQRQLQRAAYGTAPVSLA